MLRPLLQKDSQQTFQHNPDPSVMLVSEAGRIGDVIVIEGPVIVLLDLLQDGTVPEVVAEIKPEKYLGPNLVG